MTGFTISINQILLDNPDFEFPAKEQDLMDLDNEYYYDSLENSDKPFTGVMYVLDWVSRHEKVADYLSSVSFFESFFTLGMSLRALGYKEEAQLIFNTLRNVPAAGVWQKRAAAGYADPGLISPEIIY